jgi:hypothetical protein
LVGGPRVNATPTGSEGSIALYRFRSPSSKRRLRNARLRRNRADCDETLTTATRSGFFRQENFARQVHLNSSISHTAAHRGRKQQSPRSAIPARPTLSKNTTCCRVMPLRSRSKDSRLRRLRPVGLGLGQSATAHPASTSTVTTSANRFFMGSASRITVRGSKAGVNDLSGFFR